MKRIIWPVRAVVIVIGILIGLLGANLFFLHIHSGSYQVTMGDGIERLFLESFHHVEIDDEGIPYRWTTNQSRIQINGFVSASSAWLSLTIGGMPPQIAPRPLTLHIDQSPLITFGVPSHTRNYRVLLPPTALHDGALEVWLQSETSRVPPDRRSLGVRIQEVEIGWLAPSIPMPTLRVLLVQVLLVGAVVGLLRSVRVPRWGMMLGGGGSIVAAGWMMGAMLLFAADWQFRILISTAIILAIRLVIAPYQKEDEPDGIQWLWLITIGAMVIRMICILYPPFLSHDWYIHLERMNDFVGGKFLLYDKPAEFSKKLTIVPPAPYLLYTPFLLLIKQIVPATQLVYTLADGFTVLLTGMLVRRFGGGRRAAGIAALIIALFPLHFTALWWGFGPQVIGQQLVVLLAYLLAQRHIRHNDRRFWLLAFTITTMLLLSHVGAGILGGSLLVCYTALTVIVERSWYPHWKGWALIVISSGIAVTLLLYSHVLMLQFQGLSSNERLGWDADDLFRIPWTILSLYPSFKPIGVTVPAVSLLIAVWTTRSTHRWLVLSWLLTAITFFVIDLITGLQVRYAYFVLPMVAVGLAFLLDHLICRHRWGGRVVAWGMLGIIAVAGLHLWFEGIFLGIKPSLRGLTH